MADDAHKSPPGRQVVLARVGPSKKRPIIIDSFFGTLGAFLLVAAVALVNILPEEEVVNPQYRVEFLGDLAPQSPYPTQTVYLEEGESHTFEFEVEHHNVYRLDLAAILIEDHPATLPDSIQILITSPNGTQYEYPIRLETWETEPHPDRTQTAFYRINKTDPRPLTQNIGGVPRAYFETASPDAQLFEVRDEVRAKWNREETIGIWTVTVTMVDAGDCPEASPVAETGSRGAECRLQNPNDSPPEGATPVDSSQPETDPGNHVGFNFGYLYYEIAVTGP